MENLCQYWIQGSNSNEFRNIFIHRHRHHRYHCDYTNHHLTSTLLPNLLPTDSSRHFVQHHFDQRLAKINRKGIILLPEIITDHEERGWYKIFLSYSACNSHLSRLRYLPIQAKVTWTSVISTAYLVHLEFQWLFIMRLESIVNK